MPTTTETDLEDVDGTSVPTTIRSSVVKLDKEVPANDTISVASNDLLDVEPEPSKFTDWLFRRHENKTIDLDSTATRRSVYGDLYLAKNHRPKSDYEIIHRFNPKAHWTLQEERALVRKLDWKSMRFQIFNSVKFTYFAIQAAIDFSALNLDPHNINPGQANSDHLLGDLGVTTNGSVTRNKNEFHIGESTSASDRT